MPLNGSGLFNRLRRWAGEANISQTEFDQDGDDVAAALSNALYRDGQASWTGNQNAAGKLLRGLSAPQSPGDALSLGSTPAGEIKSALGFTPVQQGAGPGQAGNVVSVGYRNGGGALKASVDGTDFGALLSTLMQVASGNGYAEFPLPGGYYLLAFLATVNGQAYVNYPVPFPNGIIGGVASDQGPSAFRWGFGANGSGSCQLTCRDSTNNLTNGTAFVMVLGN